SGEMVRVGDDAVAHYRWGDNRYYRDPAAPAWRWGRTSSDFAAWRQATGLGARDEALAADPDSKVFVRPNKYEAGRATIVVYNWQRQAAVPVDVRGLLRDGDRYELRNVQALFGAPVVSGTYAGDAIVIPMAGVDPPPAIGRPGPPPQRTPEPGGERDPESLLASFDEAPRDIAIQHLSQDPLALAVSDLAGQRQPPRELDDAMIEQGNARFQAHPHARTVHLDQDVIREIRDEVEVHPQTARVPGHAAPGPGSGRSDPRAPAPGRSADTHRATHPLRLPTGSP